MRLCLSALTVYILHGNSEDHLLMCCFLSGKTLMLVSSQTLAKLCQDY